MSDKMDIRDYFPNLNEFCSNDADKLIKWLNDHNIKDYSWFDGTIMGKWMHECPHVEFVMDGFKNKFYHLPEFDEFVNFMVIDLDLGDMTIDMLPHYDKIRQFYNYRNIDKKVRGRIIVWELSHILLKSGFFNDKSDRWSLIRYTIANNMLNFYLNRKY